MSRVFVEYVLNKFNYIMINVLDTDRIIQELKDHIANAERRAVEANLRTGDANRREAEANRRTEDANFREADANRRVARLQLSHDNATW